MKKSDLNSVSLVSGKAGDEEQVPSLNDLGQRWLVVSKLFDLFLIFMSVWILIDVA